MYRLLCLAALLTLTACERGPRAGDVYEDPMTREREEVAYRGSCSMGYHYLVRRGFVPMGEPDTLGEGIRGIAAFSADDTLGADCVATISERGTLNMRTGRLSAPADFQGRRLVRVN